MGTDQEIDDDGNLIVEVELDDEGNPIVEAEVELDDEGNLIVEVELDDDGNPVVKDELEPWQLTADDDGLPDVPVGKHIKMKRKLQGRVQDRDDELATVKAELANLKAAGNKPQKLPPRPKPDDFASDELYDEAVDEWNDKKLDIRLQTHADTTGQAEAVAANKQAVSKAVDAHYDRSAQLVEDSGIKAEYFKEADTAVRESIEAILPKQGDAVTDHVISLLGEGSEKVMYFIGRNKAARTEFQNLLAKDKTGMKAMVFLGQQKERLTNPRKPTSKAPKPAADVNGDAAPSQKASALKKKYDAAHKANKTQVAYDIKKQAKAAKIDVSTW